jgi:hypothetical protein
VTNVQQENEYMDKFQSHKGFARPFADRQLTLGLTFPLESYTGSFPTFNLEEQMTLAKKAENLGFASLFVRDAPLYDANFGDVGAFYDPWIFLAYVAAHTDQIALGTASIVTTLRHPLHVAKSAASIPWTKYQNSASYWGLRLVTVPLNFLHLKWILPKVQHYSESL